MHACMALMKVKRNEDNEEASAYNVIFDLYYPARSR